MTILIILKMLESLRKRTGARQHIVECTKNGMEEKKSICKEKKKKKQNLSQKRQRRMMYLQIFYSDNGEQDCIGLQN